jgi:hypothetical protein
MYEFGILGLQPTSGRGVQFGARLCKLPQKLRQSTASIKIAVPRSSSCSAGREFVRWDGWDPAHDKPTAGQFIVACPSTTRNRLADFYLGPPTGLKGTDAAEVYICLVPS